MIIFLYGQDTYRLREKIKEIVERYKKIHTNGLSLFFFDLSQKNYQDFWSEFQTNSMFKEKKLCILENSFLNEDFQKNFLSHSRVFLNSEDVILFYEDRKVLGNAFFKFLKKEARSQEFKLLEGQKLRTWVKKEFNKQGGHINSRAIEKLLDFTGNDMWQLSNEIKKLVSFKNNQKIETGDVEILVRPKIETDIFQTIDSIALKNKKQALGLIHNHIKKGDSPLYLLSMITFQFRNLLMVRELIEKREPYYSFSKKTQLHPYVVKKSYSQAQKFALEDLKKIYRKIFQVDLEIKTGKTEPRMALDLLIASL